MNMDSLVSHDTDNSRDWLTRQLLVHLTEVYNTSLGREAAKLHLRAVAMRLACAIDERYRAVLHVSSPLSMDEFLLQLTELQEHFHVGLLLTHADTQRVSFCVECNPWDDINEERPGVSYLLACLVGAMTALNFGYAHVQLDLPVGQRARQYQIHLSLDPDQLCSDEGGIVYTRQEVEATCLAHSASSAPAPSEMVCQCERNTERDQEECDALGHRKSAIAIPLEHALEIERAAAEQLRSFNRMQQDFLSNVSHEFRTPITAIQGYLALVLQEDALGELNASQREALETVQRNIDRLNTLVTDVLDFSQLSRGQLLLEGTPVEVADVLVRALERNAEAARLRNITLQRHYPTPLGLVNGDEEKLVQVVSHLLENAVKYSESGHDVTLSAYTLSRHIVIEVQDTGIGMTPQQLRDVFTPFVQGESGLSRRYGGLGMGLSLMSSLVSLHGGEMKICSQPGKGTTVFVSLPLFER